MIDELKTYIFLVANNFEYSLAPLAFDDDGWATFHMLQTGEERLVVRRDQFAGLSCTAVIEVDEDMYVQGAVIGIDQAALTTADGLEQAEVAITETLRSVATHHFDSEGIGEDDQHLVRSSWLAKHAEITVIRGTGSEGNRLSVVIDSIFHDPNGEDDESLWAVDLGEH